METNPSKSRGESPAGKARQLNQRAVDEPARQRILQKAAEAEKGSLERLTAVATKETTHLGLSPVKRAALGRLEDLTGELGLLVLQAQREGPRSVEPACEQALDEINRLLAVLSSPNPEGDPA